MITEQTALLPPIACSVSRASRAITAGRINRADQDPGARIWPMTTRQPTGRHQRRAQ